MSDEMTNQGFRRLGESARVGARMRTSGSYTPEDEDRLCQALDDVRLSLGKPGKPCPWTRIATMVGVRDTVLSQWRHKSYKGDRQFIDEHVDEFLAKHAARQARHQLSEFTTIEISREIFGVLDFGGLHRSCPALIFEHGGGKTVHWEAYAADRPDRYLIRPIDSHRDGKGVSILLCKAIPALRKRAAFTHARRMEGIIEHLQAHLNAYILVDEAQRLTRSGLETLRDIHDTTTVPIAFAGDTKFFRLIGDAREGRPSTIEAQLSSRIYPILQVEGLAVNSDGELYTAADLLKVLRAERVKVISPDGCRWLTRLANISGWGRLRLAVAVFKAAREIAGNQVVEVEHLVAGLGMVHVSEEVRLAIDEAAGGGLLVKVG